MSPTAIISRAVIPALLQLGLVSWSANSVVVAQGPAGSSSASSANYFIASRQPVSGGAAQSQSYALVGCVAGGGNVQSTSFRLDGGFAASLTTPTFGSPWLAAARPRFATPRSAVTVTLLGTGLDLGSNPAVRVGGVPAPVTARSGDSLQVTLPSQPAPGWQGIELTNSGGTSILAQGIGILPMIYCDPPAATSTPFRLVFKGSQRDTVVWALGIGATNPVPLSGFGFGLGLSTAVLFVMPGASVLPASGELALPIPASAYVPASIYAQALFLSTDPGYAPGSFSNVLRF
jgi:hypothetical protein